MHTGPRGKALLKGNKIISPLSDEAEVVLRVVRDLVPTDGELGGEDPAPGRAAGEALRVEGEAELRRADLASDPLEQFRRWFVEARRAPRAECDGARHGDLRGSAVGADGAAQRR